MKVGAEIAHVCWGARLDADRESSLRADGGVCSANATFWRRGAREGRQPIRGSGFIVNAAAITEGQQSDQTSDSNSCWCSVSDARSLGTRDSTGSSAMRPDRPPNSAARNAAAQPTEAPISTS